MTGYEPPPLGAHKLTTAPETSQQPQYYRVRNNYLYYFGCSLLYLQYNGPQSPILIIKAPVAVFTWLDVGLKAQKSNCFNYKAEYEPLSAHAEPTGDHVPSCICIYPSYIGCVSIYLSIYISVYLYIYLAIYVFYVYIHICMYTIPELVKHEQNNAIDGSKVKMYEQCNIYFKDVSCIEHSV